MLFSDNVPVEDEVALKTAAAARGLLVMGPDCGTAVVGGVGLGFANAVRPGPVSLVAASGTGAQHLMALLDQAGVGVRHCLGLGGRDLGAAVGGLGARSALDVLAADDATELVVVVSKPADPQVVSRLEEHAARLGHASGLGRARSRPARPHHRRRGGAGAAGDRRRPPGAPGASGPHRRRRRAAARACSPAGRCATRRWRWRRARLGPVASNVPLDPSWPSLDASGPAALAGAFAAAGHAVVDLGDDTLTVGRAHPMIDPTLRLEALSPTPPPTRGCGWC